MTFRFCFLYLVNRKNKIISVDFSTFRLFDLSQPKKKSGGGYDSYQTTCASGWWIDAGKPSNNEGDPLDTV